MLSIKTEWYRMLPHTHNAELNIPKKTPAQAAITQSNILTTARCANDWHLARGASPTEGKVEGCELADIGES